MKLTVSTICCFLLLLEPIFQQRNDDFLDLTKPKRPQKERAGGRGTGGGGGMGNGHIPPRTIIPMKVTLLSLDKSSYQLGDQVIYEVVLENITQDTLLIPWSDDYDEVKPDEDRNPPGYIHASLSLEIKDERGVYKFMALQPIVGSQMVRGSLKSLRQGQKVRIRAPGSWWFTSEDEKKRVLEKLPQTFEVRARFDLEDRPIDPRYEPALSANSLTVELRKRQQ